MMSDSYWFLKDCDLFAYFTDADIKGLESVSRTRDFRRGEPIYLPNEAADGVLLVAQGRVKICHSTPDGKQSILNFVDAGELFGELSLFGNCQRQEFAEAIEHSTIVLIPKTVMLNLMARHPHLNLGITKLIGSRRQRIERRLRNLLFRSNRERVVHLLIELAEKYGHRVGAGIELGIKLSHLEFASVIGSTRETVTVVLGQLQSEQLIKIARRRITILDLKSLSTEVDEPLASIEMRMADASHARQDGPAADGVRHVVSASRVGSIN
jgi:CRP-like cAMP-binding protein